MKIYRILIIAVLLILMGRTYADNLSVDDLTMSPGDTKSVNICLTNPDRHYVAFQFDLTFPEGITIALNNKGKLMANLDTERADDHTMSVSEIGDNTYRFLTFSMTNAEFYGTSGALVNVTLRADANTSNGAKTATLKSQVFTATNGDQYKWNDVTFEIQVQPAVIPEITAEDKTREYGEDNPTFTYTSSTELNGIPSLSTSAIKTSPVGDYSIVVGRGTIEGNYTANNGKLTITQAPLTISAGNYTIKQGDPLPTFVATFQGFKNGETAAVLTKQPTLTTSVTSSSALGTYDIVVAEAEAQNYSMSFIKGTLTIIQADAVVITAQSYSREYGEANPSFEYTSSGASLVGVPEITCDATAISPAGSYPIVIKKGGVTNYNDSYVNGTLTITKAPLTIKAGTFTKKQGEENPEFTLIYEGFKNNETEAVLTKKPMVTCTATAASEPGEYEVIISGGEAQNYELTYNKGKLIVMEADAVVIIANDYTRKYGEGNPNFDYTSSGTNLEGIPDISCDASVTSPVGAYPIVINKGSVTNYNDTYVNGTLTITKAPLTVTAGTYMKKQGEENPEFTLTYEGFKNNETEAVLAKKPTVTCTATASSEPGEYEVIVNGGEAQNYELSYTKGKLIVAEADPVVVTANSYTRGYGEENPTFEYSSSGADLEGVPLVTCEATATSPVGTYPIVIKKGGVTNYNDTYVNGTLTITKAPLSVKLGTFAKKVGEENPEFTLSYSGFKNNETESVLSKKPVVTTTATKESAPGEYEIAVSGGEASNYELSYTKGKLIVMEADAVVIIANDYTRKYGDGNPSFDFTSSGASLVGAPEITCEATATSPVGTYPIVIKKGSVTNNNDTYINGTLTITKAPLTVTAGTYTKKQGEENPEFTLTYEGFKNNETEAVLTKKPTVTCTATASSEPSEYEVALSAGEAENYELSYTKGKLIVTEADPVIVTANNYTREYGEENPTFEYTSSGVALAGEPVISCEATATSPAGTYPIVIKKGSVTNYNDSYVNGTLTITKAPLTVTAGTYTKKQGEENPEFTLTYEGFKNNETEIVLTKEPTVTCMATATSEPGEYEVTVSDGEAQNYELSYVSGTLTVTVSSGIEELKGKRPFDFYDLSGRKLDVIPTKNLKKGVYIVGGRKVVIK